MQPQGGGVAVKKKSELSLQIQTQGDRELLGPDFVNIEKNLSSLGFFTPSNKSTTGPKSKTINLTTNIDGKRVRITVTINPSVESGLPTIADQDKYFAFQKILYERRQEGEEIKNPVGFTSAELLRLMDRRVKTGKNYESIEEWLERMTSTTIKSKGSVYHAGKRAWLTDIFHVFERSIAVGKMLDDRTTADRNYVWLSEWQLANINNNYVLPVDFEAYKKLKNHISKALVPILQVWLYASQDEGVFEKRYDELCEYLNVRKYQHLSKIKEKLSPALDELVRYGYISAWEVQRTADGRGFKLVLRHGEKFYADRLKRLADRPPKGAPEFPALPGGAGTQPETLSPEQERLYHELVEKFRVAPAKAKELVTEKFAAAKVQLACYDLRKITPESPAGWIVTAIEKHHANPSDFAPPQSYHKPGGKAARGGQLEGRRAAILACPVCRDTEGWRYVTGKDGRLYVVECTHDPGLTGRSNEGGNNR
jgi:hypothetical protein